ncbi:MAG: hypothetical protein D6797_09450 [Bdellovibrio sp.]|nr:MAG: hypothetical protein D6797_09450 [Bdellovibrio sp.]
MKKRVCVALLLMSELLFASSRIRLNPVLKQALASVLEAATQLQEALHDGEKEKVEERFDVLIQEVEFAKDKTGLSPDIQPHLDRILNAAKIALDVGRREKGKKRVFYLKKAYKNIVQLRQVYRVGKQRVFFCPKDKAVWVQKGWRPKNPFHPRQYGSCGKVIQ